MLRRMLPFLRKEDHRWESLDNQLTLAFGKVKEDTKNLFSWMTYFHRHMADHRHETAELRTKFSEHNRYLHLLYAHIKHLEKKIEILEARAPQIVHVREPSTYQVRTESEPSANQKRTRFEDKIFTRIKTKKKPYIMQKILETIGSEGHSTKELERIIVEEQQLCGRTAFYSYLRELRLKKQIALREKEFDKVLVRI